MGDNDWVIWNVYPRGHVLRDSYIDRHSWTIDLDAGLAFDTRAEAEAVARDGPGTGGGIVSQRGWVKESAVSALELRRPPPRIAA